MRFLHTSDWQIGKAFRFVDEETLAVLRAERLDVISRIGRLAQDHQACAVLVAGDIFDVGHVSIETLLKPIERMRQFASIQWHLIPGNHDAHQANGPWDRLLRSGLPANITIHITSDATPLADDSAWVIPAILTQRHMTGDPTEDMNQAATPAGAIRIGLAHGSIRNFGTSESSTHNVIAIDRASRSNLDYLALGDWHGASRIDDRTWYSGTPESDGFDVGGNGGGQLLLVELDTSSGNKERSTPKVSVLDVGRFKWCTDKVLLSSRADVVALETRLRGLDGDLSRILLRLQVEGTLDLAAREEFEQQIRVGLGSALRMLRLETDGLYLKPSPSDLEAIDHVGFVRSAADQLATMAADVQNADREIAAEALQRLYVLHMRQEAGAQ
jgi:DNA repair exonuclease SbcCD nuclease subunit